MVDPTTHPDGVAPDAETTTSKAESDRPSDAMAGAILAATVAEAAIASPAAVGPVAAGGGWVVATLASTVPVVAADRADAGAGEAAGDDETASRQADAPSGEVELAHAESTSDSEATGHKESAAADAVPRAAAAAVVATADPLPVRIAPDEASTKPDEAGLPNDKASRHPVDEVAGTDDGREAGGDLESSAATEPADPEPAIAGSADAARPERPSDGPDIPPKDTGPSDTVGDEPNGVAERTLEEVDGATAEGHPSSPPDTVPATADETEAGPVVATDAVAVGLAAGAVPEALGLPVDAERPTPETPAAVPVDTVEAVDPSPAASDKRDEPDDIAEHAPASAVAPADEPIWAPDRATVDISPAPGAAIAPGPATPAPAPTAAAQAAQRNAASVLGPAVRDEFNRTNLDYRRPMPRPKVRGRVIDFHCHLFALRHAADWFEAADHYGMDVFLTMSPLEEATGLAREWGHRLRFNAMPSWGDTSSQWVSNWLVRIESFYNLGSRISKFHASPGTMAMRGVWLDAPEYKPIFAELKARKMAIMTHIGDPDTWYNGRYDPAKFGSRDDHYRMWEGLLDEHRGTPWVGAHLGGNPEDLPRLQRLLDKFPDLMLDCSATRWMVREVSARRDAAREFFIRNQDRILFGSDQVSGHDRHFDFLASRIWCHRKLWETAYTGPSPIIDPDVPKDDQPVVRGLALPDVVLQKIYHDNATKLLDKLGMGFDR